MYITIIGITFIIMYIFGFYIIRKNSKYTATNGLVFKKDKIKCIVDGKIDNNIISSCTTCNKSVFENMMEMCSNQYKQNYGCRAISGKLTGTTIKYTPCSRFTVDNTNPITGGFIE